MSDIGIILIALGIALWILGALVKEAAALAPIGKFCLILGAIVFIAELVIPLL